VVASIKRYLSEQLGRILLGVAILWALAGMVLNRSIPPGIRDDPVQDYKRRVQVDFRPEELAPHEDLFISQPAETYRGTAREAFGPIARREKPKAYEGLQLPDVTHVPVAAPPMLLPAPGPSLQGADKLPRWGEELPPVYIPPPPEPKSTANDPSRKAAVVAPNPPGPPAPPQRVGPPRPEPPDSVRKGGGGRGPR
jgi:hypothetical protein